MNQFCLVRLKPAHEFVVRIAFHWNSPNEFADEVLAVKSAFAGAPVNANLLNRSLDFVAGYDLSFNSILSCGKFQEADCVAFLPFAIRFLAYITNVCGDHVYTLQQQHVKSCTSLSRFSAASHCARSFGVETAWGGRSRGCCQEQKGQRRTPHQSCTCWPPANGAWGHIGMACELYFPGDESSLIYFSGFLTFLRFVLLCRAIHCLWCFSYKCTSQSLST